MKRSFHSGFRLLISYFILYTSYFLLLSSALAQTTYTESAAASDLTAAQTCNAISAPGSLAPQVMAASGAASGSYSVGITKGATQNFALYSPAGDPNSTSWAGGNWVVSLNVTTANSNLTWTDTCIVRVNSSGAAQATVGSLTGQSISLGATGVETMTLSGAAQTAAASDRIAVVMNFKNSNSHNTQSVSFEAGGASDTVTSPLTPTAPARNRAIVISEKRESESRSQRSEDRSQETKV